MTLDERLKQMIDNADKINEMAERMQETIRTSEMCKNMYLEVTTGAIRLEKMHELMSKEDTPESIRMLLDKLKDHVAIRTSDSFVLTLVALYICGWLNARENTTPTRPPEGEKGEPAKPFPIQQQRSTTGVN